MTDPSAGGGMVLAFVFVISVFVISLDYRHLYLEKIRLKADGPYYSPEREKESFQKMINAYYLWLSVMSAVGLFLMGMKLFSVVCFVLGLLLIVYSTPRILYRIFSKKPAE